MLVCTQVELVETGKKEAKEMSRGNLFKANGIEPEELLPGMFCIGSNVYKQDDGEIGYSEYLYYGPHLRLIRIIRSYPPTKTFEDKSFYSAREFKEEYANFLDSLVGRARKKPEEEEARQDFCRLIGFKVKKDEKNN